jgi:hypothetical protein
VKLYGGYGGNTSYILNYWEIIIIFTALDKKKTLGICLIEGWMRLLAKDRHVTLLSIMPQSFERIATHFTNCIILTHCFVCHKRDALSAILNLYFMINYGFCRFL